jgi:hypothetical protein
MLLPMQVPYSDPIIPIVSEFLTLSTAGSQRHLALLLLQCDVLAVAAYRNDLVN